ncbi:MAG: hypothetical protein ACMXYF_02085 [Candidatus Woesearchaeota archaeon]
MDEENYQSDTNELLQRKPQNKSFTVSFYSTLALLGIVGVILTWNAYASQNMFLLSIGVLMIIYTIYNLITKNTKSVAFIPSILAAISILIFPFILTIKPDTLLFYLLTISYFCILGILSTSMFIGINFKPGKIIRINIIYAIILSLFFLALHAQVEVLKVLSEQVVGIDSVDTASAIGTSAITEYVLANINLASINVILMYTITLLSFSSTHIFTYVRSEARKMISLVPYVIIILFFFLLQAIISGLIQTIFTSMP